MQIPIFEINNVTLQSGSFRALDIKKFEIHRGAIYSISGKPASGKSILLQVLARDAVVTSGDVKFEGKPIAQVNKSEFNDQLAVVKQTVKAPWGLTTEGYITKVLKKYSHARNDISKRIESISKKMELGNLLDKKMTKLTPGQLRWVELAAKIAADTKVLMIDEIEQHLTTDSLNNLIRILYRKSNYDGVTIVLTTLTPEVLKKMVSVYIAMQGGRISSVRSYSKHTGGKRRSGGKQRSGGSGDSDKSRKGTDQNRSGSSRSKSGRSGGGRSKADNKR